MLDLGIEVWLPVLTPCVLAVLYAMFKSPKVWLSVSIFLLPVFLTSSGEGLTFTEFAFGVFYTLPVIVWIVWYLATKSEPLIRWWGDFFIVMFMAFSGLNIFISLLNGVDAVGWLSEWSLYFLILYYFPLREHFGDSESSLKQLLSVSSVSGLVMAISSIYMYKQKMTSGFAFAYQVWSSRSVLLGPVFLLIILIGIAVLFHSEIRAKILIFLMIVASSAALFLTFTRTLWVSFFLCLPIVMARLTGKQNLKLTVSMFAMAAIAVAGFYLYNPRLTKVVTKVVQNRFLSASQLSGGDGSFETRLVEARAAFTFIKRYPMGGNGLRKTFLTWTINDNYHGLHSFVHIGYVGLIYKLGFPTAIVFFICLGLFSWKSIKTYFLIRALGPKSLVRAVAIGIAAAIPSLLLIIFMASFFDTRYGNIMFAFVFAFIAISSDLAAQNTPRNQEPQ